MLRPRKLVLKNFLSFSGEHTYRYERGVSIVQGFDYDVTPPGSMGSGKTALAGYAPTWCIFGKLPQEGFKVDDVINRYVGGPTSVYWKLEDREFRVEIERIRTAKKTTLNVLINGEVPKGYPADTPARERWLWEWLGLDYGLWNSTVFLSPGSRTKAFFDCSPTERMDIISLITEDGIYKEAGKKLGPKIGTLEREVMLLEGQKNQLQQTITHLEHQLGILQENMQRESERIRGAQEIIQRDTTALEMEILRLQDEMRKGPGTDHTQVQLALGDASRKTNEATKLLGEIEFRLRSLPSLSSGTCPTCLQPITPVHASKVQLEAEQLTQKRVELQRELLRLQEHKTTIEAQYSEHLNWPARQRALQQEIDNLRLRAYTAREGINNNLMIQYSNQCDVLEGQLRNFGAEMLRCNTEIDSKRLEIQKLEIVRAGFNTEIRYMIVDGFRDLLQFYANQDLQLLGREGWSLAFSSERGEKESFVIEPQYLGERMELPSKGQRHKFSLAVTSGLIKALYHQRPHRVGLLVVDDPIGDLDDNGQRELGSLLQDLAEKIPVVMVTLPKSGSALGDFSEVKIIHRNQESSIQR